MKLTASVIVRDELDRYLDPFLRHLLAFVDEIRILDDGSSDGWAETFAGGRLDADLERIYVLRAEASTFFEDEGRARQALLDWTLEGEPTHVLAVDCDEFVADGPMLRQLLERQPGAPAWSLTMQEVWKAADECVCVRQDGGWRQHEVPILYRVNAREIAREAVRPVHLRRWRIPDRKLAPGREPVAVRNLARTRNVARTFTEILHLGWACEADRAARYQRYVDHDGGRFHNRAHLDSIMWPDARVKLDGHDWPASLAELKPALLARISREAPVGD